MHKDTLKDLHEEDIYEYGSKELETFEKRLTRYFAREYQRHRGSDGGSAVINKGPLALAAIDLAENHYDEGMDFFNAFLDHETMSYTMAFFDEEPEQALKSSKTLGQAQRDKFRLINDRINLKGNERILNLGCGFGYFESYLLDKYPDIQVSATTHSQIQYNFLLERMKDPNDALSSQRFNMYFGEIDQDNSMGLAKGKYDVVISAGLLEQINNIEMFFAIINELLVDNGKMFHHLIVSRDLIPQFLNPEETMIGEYFPGGRVLPFSALQRDFDRYTLIGSWFINGMNYWKTLDQWHSNFWNNLDSVYPATMDKQRLNHWNNYFALCKSMFLPELGAAYGNGQYLYIKS
ncbi:MAG: class I SAM-dependent methyltransferase [Gammaproteobacteria bacterium]|jgi:cyclopropane-fatty-acyl-phospholipid synthase